MNVYDLMSGVETRADSESTRGHVALNNSLPAFERVDVLSREREPFTFSTFISESPVPVGLHSNGVVGFDAVNGRRRNWNLDGQLASSTANGLRTADLVMRPRLHEIDEPGRNFNLTFPLFADLWVEVVSCSP
jgi:hypothetical protein